MTIYQDAGSTWGKSLDGDFKCERDKVSRCAVSSPPPPPLLTLACLHVQVRGFVFRTKAKNDKAVRAIPTVNVCQVLKDGIHFTTSACTGHGG